MYTLSLAEESEKTGELLVDLGSDQTSLHNPYTGGYYPVQLSFEEAREVMVKVRHVFFGKASLLRGSFKACVSNQR